MSVIALLPCLECGLITLAACGILCANYSAKRGGFAMCKGFWCGECYGVSEESNRFPIKRGVDMGVDGELSEDPRDKGRFLMARAGDHLMHNFQCDECHFRNIHKVNPALTVHFEDKLLLECIRRCNLDALWSKEPTTVERNRRDVLKTIDRGKRLRLASEQLFSVQRPHSLEDSCAVAFAASMMIRSLDPGKNEDYVQFNTVRSMRGAFSNYWKASCHRDDVSVLMKGQTKMIVSSSPSNSIWFKSFMMGFHKRVGDLSLPDKAVSIELMCSLMNRFEEQWEAAKEKRFEEQDVILPALFALVAYVGILRGKEVPLMDLNETRLKTQMGLNHPSSPHVVIALTGKFKNEVGLMKHFIPVMEVTRSGLNVRVWLERMLLWYGPARKGYVFTNEKGHRVQCGHYAEQILGTIRDIQNSARPEERGILELDCDVFEEFGMSRSFRRGSDSRALAAGVNEATVDLMNRWRTVERTKGRTASLKMNQHYSDVRLLLELYLPYLAAL